MCEQEPIKKILQIEDVVMMYEIGLVEPIGSSDAKDLAKAYDNNEVALKLAKEDYENQFLPRGLLLTIGGENLYRSES